MEIEKRMEFVHDLRMPMQIIYSCAQMIQMEVEEKGSAAATYIEMLMENVQEARRMLDEYLRSERGDMEEIRLVRGDLAASVRELCRSFECLAEDSGVKLLFSSNAARMDMMVDGEKVMRILRNLLSNALKYTPEGGSVRVELNAMGDFAEVSVIDSGRGIAPEVQERIFDRSYTTDGFGLGLHIARCFARMHGGEISVKSALGEGSAFTLRLPVCARIEEEARGAETEKVRKSRVAI